MASFQAKPRWERPRMRLKKKKNLSFRSIPTRPGIGNFNKIEKKNEKNQKTSLCLHFKPKLDGTGCE